MPRFAKRIKLIEWETLTEQGRKGGLVILLMHRVAIWM